ncbi:ABC transporter substrate-binding protein [Jatrophihabitans lederbergiae]|uniref:ABC transporter substrate-binding protein n=1 Tax=Jatrophihabitans lederbergiae TaxID=3075547 RepID=A0ABU2JDM2_9ACTN|nr:ABC transporter substrate-binding protein [Jatrophihabitans sp. DSM 44399]MDT0263088.1 ABC transporter substrate-binding protein [Jatrophihabitans sp. DSM 44399]
MRLTTTIAGVCVCVAATVLAGCGGKSNGGKATGGGKVVNGGTFTMALTADPGNLDPQASASTGLFQVSHFAYDSLTNVDLNGKLSSGLADTWKATGHQVTLTLRDKITCSDGTPFTADDAVANLNYIAAPKNKSPFLGVFLPAGVKASASGSTVTLTLASPAPFVLQGLSNVPMVCKTGMTNRSVLAHQTRGTGPYTLKEDVAGDHITFAKRTGYTWGPGGATTATPGMPDTVVVKIVSNETTAANLLLSGGLNAASVIGPDAQRLKGANLFAAQEDSLLGEMWFNHATSRPGADAAVRKALTQAVDLTQLEKVLTSNSGRPGTTFAAAPPVACPGDSISSALPPHGLDKAKQTLDDAGWKAGPNGTRTKNGTPLHLTFLYDTAYGSGGSAAAELATSTWKQLGATVTMQGQDDTQILQTVIGGSGNWDVAWLQLNVNSPDQLVPFLSGPAAPAGSNFGHIANAAYQAGVAKAMTMQGTEGCSTWLAAESNLIKDADVIPFANRVISTFGKNARFDSGQTAVVPTSIRMLAG